MIEFLDSPAFRVTLTIYENFSLNLNLNFEIESFCQEASNKWEEVMKLTKAIFLLLFISFSLLYAGGKQNRIVVNVDLGKVKISKYIYGHFSEHLGHCIYGGIWVGEDSSIRLPTAETLPSCCCLASPSTSGLHLRTSTWP